MTVHGSFTKLPLNIISLIPFFTSFSYDLFILSFLILGYSISYRSLKSVLQIDMLGLSEASSAYAELIETKHMIENTASLINFFSII